MKQPELIKVSIATSSAGVYNGDATVHPPFGRLLQARVIRSATGTAMSTKAHLTITGSTTGYVYLNVPLTSTVTGTSFRPRQAVQDTSGGNYHFINSATASETTLVPDYLYVGGEDLTINVSSGGNSKTGSVFLWVG